MLRYEEFVKTDEYKKLIWSHPLDNNIKCVNADIFLLAKGDLTITGDIKTITKFDRNNISVGIIYDNSPDMLGDYKSLCCEIHNGSKSLIDDILSLNIPSKVTFKIRPLVHDKLTLGGEFEIMQLLDYSNKLKFHRWLCPECHKSYGLIKPEKDYCLICSDETGIRNLVEISDYFDGSFFEK